MPGFLFKGLITLIVLFVLGYILWVTKKVFDRFWETPKRSSNKTKNKNKDEETN